MANKSGFKVVLRSPVFRGQQIRQADQDLSFVERITPLAQTDEEIGMALNKHGGLKSIAARMDVTPDLFVSEEEYKQRQQQKIQSDQAQAEANQMKTLANAYQSAARGSASMQDAGEDEGFMRSLIERGMS